MGVRHIPDGQDFSSDHFPSDFGFSKSSVADRGSTAPKLGYRGEQQVQGASGKTGGRTNAIEPSHTPYRNPMPDLEPDYSGDNGGGHYAKGGEVGRKHTNAIEPSHKPNRMPNDDPEPDYSSDVGGGTYSKGGEVHPHGQDVIRTEPRGDGSMVMHHRHGGHSVQHADGTMTHHNHDGRPVESMFATGGDVHIHPSGHHVTQVVPHSDGRIVLHHDHGGHSVIHIDGHVSHHNGDGSPVNTTGMSMGGMENMHDSSEYVHRARGGHMEATEGAADKRQDAQMIKSAFRQHDKNEHDGAHEDIHLRRGGYAGKQVGLPKSMKPKIGHSHSPIQAPPRNPQATRTPVDDSAPGGQMPYGVQPSVEDGNMGGSGPGADSGSGSMPGLKRGGRAC